MPRPGNPHFPTHYIRPENILAVKLGNESPIVEVECAYVAGTLVHAPQAGDLVDHGYVPVELTDRQDTVMLRLPEGEAIMGYATEHLSHLQRVTLEGQAGEKDAEGNAYRVMYLDKRGLMLEWLNYAIGETPLKPADVPEPSWLAAVKADFE